MALEKKLESWLAAGLIDTAAADRIRTYEGDRDRPYALWAIIGLGLFALALGVMLIVAANWDAITAPVKLGVHLAMTLAAAAAVWVGRSRAQFWFTEAALFVLGALVLAGIALHAQVYQLVGELWQPLLLWLGLMTPALLVAGTTRLTGYGWSMMLLWGVGALATEHDGSDVGELFVQSIAIASPAFLILVSLLPRRASATFAVAVREIGIVALLGGASLAHFAWAEAVSQSEAGDTVIRLALPAAVAAAAVWVGYRWREIPTRMLLPLVAWPTLAVAFATVLPHGDGWPPRLVGALGFGLMWGLVAEAASASGWRILFGVAIAAIAIRIFIVYFELFGSLATTGAGLIAGGLLLIALALGWRRVFRMTGKPE